MGRGGRGARCGRPGAALGAALCLLAEHEALDVEAPEALRDALRPAPAALRYKSL